MGRVKNLAHGSRGFLRQISTKFIAIKNISYIGVEENFNDKNIFVFYEKNIKKTKNFNINKLLLPFLNESLSLEEFSLFKKKFSVKKNYFITATRCSLNNIVYHSVSYSRKGTTDSYTICFMNDEKLESYGTIEKFFLFDNEIYACVKLFIEQNNARLLPDSNFLKKHVLSQFNNYFKILYKQSFRFDIINVENIVSKCILIKNNDIHVITKIPSVYKHD